MYSLPLTIIIVTGTR
ncbi:hypothetical protein PhCBS80983_g05485 [Powellomyces hirtus]|uniref:Uncharacterized protein n=1 Tax=Powellomyces hirtus TaxID=109895 RepID=A0A507DWJ4_9FUNG|nr:hypothetical protein PhCBS80983_g05485 [Powellomyces hirtus]